MQASCGSCQLRNCSRCRRARRDARAVWPSGRLRTGRSFRRILSPKLAAGSAAGVPLLVGTNLEDRRFHRRLDPTVDDLTEDALLARLGDAGRNAVVAHHVRFEPADAVQTYRAARAARGESTTAEELWFALLWDRISRVPRDAVG